MCEINKLDTTTIRKIRSEASISDVASAIKELIENSIDAQSTIIQINLVGTGIEKISIKDNGIGMSRDSLKLCCLRYFTSKITKYDDLFSWTGLGFKGEALACIAELSEEITITSSQGEKDPITNKIISYSVTYNRDGSCIESSISPASHAKGTTVTVTNFFHHYPVRRKHFDPKKERRKILQLIYEYGISHPHIRFVLSEPQQNTFIKPSTKNNDLSSSIQQLYGSVVAENLKTITITGDDAAECINRINPPETEPEHKNFGIKEIILTIPHHDSKNIEALSKSNASKMLTFVNRRPVDLGNINKEISKAWRLQFGVSLRKYPISIVHLYLEPDTVDINVSSDKRKVILLYKSQINQVIESYISSEYPLSNIASNIRKELRQEDIRNNMSFTSENSISETQEMCEESSIDLSLENKRPSESNLDNTKSNKKQKLNDDDSSIATLEHRINDIISDEFVPFSSKIPKQISKSTHLNTNISQSMSEICNNLEDLKVIGKINKPIKAFIVKINNILFFANHKRITETVLYNELYHEYQITPNNLETPIPFSYDRFARLFNLIKKSEEDPDLCQKCWKAFTDSKYDHLLELNGYKVERKSQNEIIVNSISSLIESNDTTRAAAVKEIFEILLYICKNEGNGNEFRTELSKQYFNNLVKDEMKSMKVDEFGVDTFSSVIKRMKNAPHRYTSLLCPHDKPLFTKIADLNEISSSSI